MPWGKKGEEVLSDQKPALPLHGVRPGLALGPREGPDVLDVGGPEVAVQVRAPLHLPRRGGVELGLEPDLEDPEGRGLLEEEAGRRGDLGRVPVSGGVGKFVGFPER